jgi:carboxypeptidase family protein
MKKHAAVIVGVLLAAVLAGAEPYYEKGKDKDKGDSGRLLTGKVIDAADTPLPNAVVYLSNTRTKIVKSYIVSQDGIYRFPALSPNIDYEVYAQFNGRKSDTKTVSQFDGRQQVSINLKIDMKYSGRP